jgi:hypothetical protein
MPAGSKGNRFMMNMMLKKKNQRGKAKTTMGNSARGGKRASKQQRNV